VAPLVGLGLLLGAGSLLAQESPTPPCVPRVGEKLGVRVVEVCASHTARFGDAEAHADEALPAFWMTATPLPCSAGPHETVACETVTALEVSPVPGQGKNRFLEALVVDAATAHRTCTLRFGGRLPTPLEREQARRVLGLVSLRVREVPGPFAQVRLDDLPEWVAEGDCAKTPSAPGPGCRITPFPPVEARPRAADDVLLACIAEPAGPSASGVPLGSECLERPTEGDLRSPGCALRMPDSDVRFELGCVSLERPAAQRPAPGQAAFRCVLPESALGQIGEAPRPALP
jgi:hypothetical protein